MAEAAPPHAMRGPRIMQTQVTMYEFIGHSNLEAEPRMRKIPNQMIESEEITDSILRIIVMSYGDRPDEAGIQVNSISEEVGRETWHRVKELWRDGFGDRVWTNSSGTGESGTSDEDSERTTEGG